MKTRDKWLIFWGILGASFIMMIIIGLSGNFPQFRIPFQVLAQDDQKETVEKLPKVDGIQLQDYNDQDLLNQHLQHVSTLNERLSDPQAYASTDDLAESLKAVFGNFSDEQQIFDAYRVIYPSVSQEKSRFVNAQLVGFGKIKQESQVLDQEKEQITFVDSTGTRSNYLMNITFLDGEVKNFSIEGLGEPVKGVLNEHDSYLSKGADFETQWDEFTEENSDPQLYKTWKKTGFDPNDAAFKTLASGLGLEDSSGFAEFFQDCHGDLNTAGLVGFYHSNDSTDGNTDYTFSVPVSQKQQNGYVIHYNRLKEKITGISRI